MRSFTRFSQSAKGQDIEAVQRLLEQLILQYENNREALLPPFQVDEIKQSITFAGQGVSLADKKSKIGCTFGSEKEKRGGKFKVENKIYCKLFTLGEGSDERLMVQESWINPLVQFYGSPEHIGDIFKGHPRENVLRERCAPIIAAISDIFKRVSKIIDDSKTRSIGKAYQAVEIEKEEKPKRFQQKSRSLPGPVLLSLIPADLQREYVLHIVDAWLRGAAQKYSTGNTKHLARFFILQDHYPYVWKKPTGSRLESSSRADERSSLLGYERQTNLIWEDEEAKEDVLASYLDFQRDEAGKILTQRVNVLNDEGEWETKRVPRLVLNPAASPSYGSDYDSVNEELEKQSEKVQIQIAVRVFLSQIPEPTDDTSKDQIAKTTANHLIEKIREKLGPFYDAKQKQSTFAGKVLYIALLNNPVYKQLFQELLALARNFKKAEKAEKPKALEALEAIVNKAKRHLFDKSPEGIEDAPFVNELIQAYTFNKKEVLEEQLETNPREVFKQNELVPSHSKTATVLTEHKGENTALNIPTMENPFYAPKLWPEGRMMGKAEWGPSMPSFRGEKAPGIKSEPYRTMPWASFSLKAKKQQLENMKEDLAEAIEEENSLREKILRSDIRFVEKNLFADELVAYVKLNLAFGFEEDADFEYKEGKTTPPALFYIKSESDKTIPITLDDLLEEDQLSQVKEIIGVSKDDSIDMLEAEDQNYGFIRDPSDIVKTFLREARIKAFIRQADAFPLSGQDLQRIEAGDELFFDLKGTMYPSEQALINSLAEKVGTDPATIADLANRVVELLQREVKKDTGFSDFIRETIEFLEEIKHEEFTTSAEEVEEIPTVGIPQPQDSFEIPTLQFDTAEQFEEEPSLVAAKLENSPKTIKGFSK